MARPVAVTDAMRRRSQMPVAICPCIAKTAMPWLTGFEGHLEAEPSVGVYRFCRGPHGSDGHRAGKLAIAVGGAQMLARWGPLRGDPAVAHNAARLDLKNVGKIAAERDLELKDHRPHAAVDDVEILVHAAADRPAEGEAQGTRRDRAVFGEQSAIGEKDAGCVIADGPAVQQFPGFAVGINGPAADNPCIEQIEALLADQHRLALVDGDLRWADLDLDRYAVLPSRVLRPPSDEIYPFSGVYRLSPV